MSNKILGFLKFTDYGITDGISHFEQLKNGKVFFSQPNFFHENGTKAQKDLEGQTSVLEELNGNLAEEIIGDTSIIVPKGINFEHSEHEYRKINSPFTVPSDFENFSKKIDSAIENGLLQKILFETVEKMKQENDIVIYPLLYEKEGKIYYDTEEKSLRRVYLPKKYKIEFTSKDSEATWRISSFTKISNDMIDDNILSNDTLRKLLEDNSEKGSIARDIEGNLRPWVYIPYDILTKSLNKYRIMHGSVHYYRNNEYPFSIEDIVVNPNHLLLAKDVSYENQYEYRAMYGGPNKLYEVCFDSPVIDLGWNINEIKYGTTIGELINLKID